MVEVALTLQRRGHQVQIYTAFHDPSEGRCFQATRDGTLMSVITRLMLIYAVTGTLKVHVHGNFLPRHVRTIIASCCHQLTRVQIFGKFHLPCALLRFVYLSLRWLYDNWREPQDVVFVDQISATVPLLRVSGAKVKYSCARYFLLTKAFVSGSVLLSLPRSALNTAQESPQEVVSIAVGLLGRNHHGTSRSNTGQQSLHCFGVQRHFPSH